MSERPSEEELAKSLDEIESIVASFYVEGGCGDRSSRHARDELSTVRRYIDALRKEVEGQRQLALRAWVAARAHDLEYPQEKWRWSFDEWWNKVEYEGRFVPKMKE